MKKIKWSGVKRVFLELFFGFVFGSVFFGCLFTLAFICRDGCDVVYNETKTTDLGQNNENKAVVVVAEEKEAVQETIPEQPKHIYLGEFKLTAYCGENYKHICNDGDPSKTATGTKPTAGKTIAVDPSVIPYGTKVVIDGKEYFAEDCGGAIKGNRVDVFFDTHQDALNFGVKWKDVYVVVE